MQLINKKTESKALWKYSIWSIIIILGVIVALYYVESNKSILELPKTGDEFIVADWDWAYNLEYNPETDEYCNEENICNTRKDISDQFQNQIKILDEEVDATRISAYKELVIFLKSKEQSDCPFGYFDASPEDISHDQKDCVLREISNNNIQIQDKPQ